MILHECPILLNCYVDIEGQTGRCVYIVRSSERCCGWNVFGNIYIYIWKYAYVCVVFVCVRCEWWWNRSHTLLACVYSLFEGHVHSIHLNGVWFFYCCTFYHEKSEPNIIICRHNITKHIEQKACFVTFLQHYDRTLFRWVSFASPRRLFYFRKNPNQVDTRSIEVGPHSY